MKKTLIAGAASLALAAMPVVGAFADNPSPVIDTLTVTVNESCTFAKASGNPNSFTEAMDQNELKSDFGSSSFVANCNNAAGYEIGAEFTALARSGNTEKQITYSVNDPAAGDGTWTASLGAAGNIAANNGVLASTNSYDPAGGTTYTVTYKVATHATQPQGTYTGTATYTLTQK